MGFAYVLRLTECDRHLVQLLLRPLDWPVARALLIPGTIAAGYIVNMAIVSQSGAVAIVGSIAVPLLLRKGVSRLTVGSLLLLGASMGGELFNPAAVETVTLSKLTSISSIALARRAIPIDLLASSTALLVFWRLAHISERHHRYIASRRTVGGEVAGSAQSTAGSNEAADAAPDEPQPGAETATFRVNPVKAAIPFIPLILLFGAARLPLLRPFHDHVTILVAMLIGSVAAVVAAPTQVGKLASTYFEGMGFAYVHIISVTVCATLFAQGIIANGLVDGVAKALAGRPGPALLASLALPWGLATLSGSGAGAATSMMKALVPEAAAMHLDPAQMGILTAMGSHFGRTMSPAAAVAILCATLVSPPGAPLREIGDTTLQLTKRVALPLLAGGLVMYIAALMHLWR
jgi:DcuC family C4-dicarboxylate transporter